MIDKHALALKSAYAQEALDFLSAVPCDSAEVEAKFARLHALAHEAVKRLEHERTELVRPLNDSVKEVNDAYRSPRTQWESVKTLVGQKIAAYQTEQKNKADEARRLAADAASAGEVEACSAALAQVQDATRPEGVGIGFEWVFEVTDVTLVPRQYMVVAETIVKSHMRKFANSETIVGVPGIKFARVAKVRAGGKRV